MFVFVGVGVTFLFLKAELILYCKSHTVFATDLLTGHELFLAFG